MRVALVYMRAENPPSGTLYKLTCLYCPETVLMIYIYLLMHLILISI